MVPDRILGRSFTIQIRTVNGAKKLATTGPMKEHGRHFDVLDLIEPILSQLPDMNVTVTGHDNPWVVTSGESKDTLKATAKIGRCA